jgi:hypothetical protein
MTFGRNGKKIIPENSFVSMDLTKIEYEGETVGND